MRSITLKRYIIVISIIFEILIMTLSTVCYSLFLRTELKKNKDYELQTFTQHFCTENTSRLVSLENLTLSILATPTMRTWRDQIIPEPIDVPQLQGEIGMALAFNMSSISQYVDYIFMSPDGYNTFHKPPVYLYGRQNVTLSTYHDFEDVQAQIADREGNYFFHIQFRDGVPQMFLIRRMYNSAFSKRVTFILQINYENVCKSLAYPDREISTSLIRDNMIYFSNDPESVGTPYQVDSSLISPNIQHLSPFNEDNSMRSYLVALGDTGFQAHISFDNRILTKFIRPVLLKYLVIALMIVVVLSMFVLVFVRYLSDFLNSFLRQIMDVKNEDYTEQLPHSRIMELDKLCTTMNSLVRELNVLINVNYKSKLLLKEADIHLLQSQIKPHFLINTLTTISTKALCDGNSDIYEMASSLCTMLDSSLYNITQDSPFVPVRKEIEYIECYLNLQKVRFNHISYSVQLENPQINDYNIPRLSIEPIVENAVIHGAYQMDTPAIISINGYEDNGDLVFEITDNGGKYNSTATVSPDSHGIGIRNTNKRLELLFGHGYQITYSCKTDVYTTAIYRVPILKDDDTEKLLNEGYNISAATTEV